MSLPIPYFNFNANGLTVAFINKTTGAESYSWDFGYLVGGVPQVSAQENPNIIFPAEGVYTIKLTATNVDGSTSFTFPISLYLLPNLNLSISQMVTAELPSVIPNMDIYYTQLIRKWQLYLQTSQGISDADVFNEIKWSPVANTLIAKLIIYDLTLIAQKNVAISMSKIGTTITPGSKGAVKRIETGPSNVEWFDLSAYWANILKSGIMVNQKEEICMYARMLGIRFWFCPKVKKTKIFITGHKSGGNCSC